MYYDSEQEMQDFINEMLPFLPRNTEADGDCASGIIDLCIPSSIFPPITRSIIEQKVNDSRHEMQFCQLWVTADNRWLLEVNADYRDQDMTDCSGVYLAADVTTNGSGVGAELWQLFQFPIFRSMLELDNCRYDARTNQLEHHPWQPIGSRLHVIGDIATSDLKFTPH